MSTIERLTPQHNLWLAFVKHVRQCNMARWVLDKDNRPAQPLHILGVAEQDKIVGHISLRVQDIVSPATEWSDWEAIPVCAPDGTVLQETFVFTLFVNEKYRRKGHGRTLQLAALDITRELGCYQMRSWSSTDKTENYALKLSLGFAVDPGTFETASGYPVSGVYFVKTV